MARMRAVQVSEPGGEFELLSFSVLADVRPMIETRPLERAAEATAEPDAVHRPNTCSHRPASAPVLSTVRQARSAAHHPLVGLGSPLERPASRHRPHVGQDLKAQPVRIRRQARLPGPLSFSPSSLHLTRIASAFAVPGRVLAARRAESRRGFSL